MKEKFKIEETEDAFRAIFFPEAKDLKLHEYKKYKIMLGRVGDITVPKWLDYYKEYFTKEDAISFASNINGNKCNIEEQIKEAIEKKKQEIKELSKVYDRLVRDRTKKGKKNWKRFLKHFKEDGTHIQLAIVGLALFGMACVSAITRYEWQSIVLGLVGGFFLLIWKMSYGKVITMKYKEKEIFRW